MECAPHRIWKKLMALVLSLVLMAVMLPGALAVDLNVDAGFYFKQSRGGAHSTFDSSFQLSFTAVKYTILLHFCKPQGDFFLRFHTLRTQFRGRMHK